MPEDAPAQPAEASPPPSDEPIGEIDLNTGGAETATDDAPVADDLDPADETQSRVEDYLREAYGFDGSLDEGEDPDDDEPELEAESDSEPETAPTEIEAELERLRQREAERDAEIAELRARLEAKQPEREEQKSEEPAEQPPSKSKIVEALEAANVDPEIIEAIDKGIQEELREKYGNPEEIKKTQAEVRRERTLKELQSIEASLSNVHAHEKYGYAALSQIAVPVKDERGQQQQVPLQNLVLKRLRSFTQLPIQDQLDFTYHVMNSLVRQRDEASAPAPTVPEDGTRPATKTSAVGNPKQVARSSPSAANAQPQTTTTNPRDLSPIEIAMQADPDLAKRLGTR